jgi:hypothetical protein
VLAVLDQVRIHCRRVVVSPRRAAITCTLVAPRTVTGLSVAARATGGRLLARRVLGSNRRVTTFRFTTPIRSSYRVQLGLGSIVSSARVVRVGD